jgi:hypothetical protein
MVVVVVVVVVEMPSLSLASLSFEQISEIEKSVKYENIFYYLVNVLFFNYLTRNWCNNLIPLFLINSFTVSFSFRLWLLSKALQSIFTNNMPTHIVILIMTYAKILFYLDFHQTHQSSHSVHHKSKLLGHIGHRCNGTDFLHKLG